MTPYSANTTRLTLIQPTMEVVRAELYCVDSMMEYINTKLQNTIQTNDTRAAMHHANISQTPRVFTLPHDTGQHKLHNKQGIRPAMILQTLYPNTHTDSDTLG